MPASRTPRNLFLLLFVPLLAMSATACGSLYELPDPPPRAVWRRHSLNPAQDEARSQRHFMAAKDAVLAFVEALQENRWEDAYELLSNETRILLDDLAPDGLGETVLAQGVVVRAGSEYRVDPLDLFVITDLVDIIDEQGDEEQETYRRKEVYAISGNGDVHRVILIFEEDVWRIHKPNIELTPGAPGRRSLGP